MYYIEIVTLNVTSLIFIVSYFPFKTAGNFWKPYNMYTTKISILYYL